MAAYTIAALVSISTLVFAQATDQFSQRPIRSAAWSCQSRKDLAEQGGYRVWSSAVAWPFRPPGRHPPINLARIAILPRPVHSRNTVPNDGASGDPTHRATHLPRSRPNKVVHSIFSTSTFIPTLASSACANSKVLAEKVPQSSFRYKTVFHGSQSPSRGRLGPENRLKRGLSLPGSPPSRGL